MNGRRSGTREKSRKQALNSAWSIEMVMHIDKLYTHTAVVTHIYIHICIYSSEPCTNVHVPK